LAHDAVVYDLPPPLANRGDSARDTNALDAWFNTWENGVTVKLENPTVVLNGDLAVVHGLSRMRGVKREQGVVDNWNRRTVVLQKRDGRWQIIHEHGSYPMKMDGSAKAATDLKP